MSKTNDVTPKVNGRKLLSEFKFYSGNYSKYLNDLNKFETWEESVDRVMNMFKIKYQDKLPLLENHLNFATKQYKEKRALASQRALQFAFADPNYGILKHNSKLYNCLSSYADRPQFFQEAMYWLLSGCGVGFRVFQKDVDNYKLLTSRDKGVKTFVIEDSIEGWSDAFGVLISSFISNQNTLYKQVPFKEYNEYRILFDFSLIREEGSLISGGFKAPGPKGLKASLEKTEELLVKSLKKSGKLETIDVYDIVMHMADAVLSGGVRRSATICLFDKTDNLMLNAKTGDWFKNNPQRARSNNSVLINKNTITKEEFDNIFEFIRDWGEPGFVLTEDTDITYNPLNVAA